MTRQRFLLLHSPIKGLLSFVCMLVGWPALAGDRIPDNSQIRLSRTNLTQAIRQAAEFFHRNVAVHGGYVYHYSLDLATRWGEGPATSDQIWVQPPGTPTVGMAYLKAYEVTGNKFYLNAATAAATALVYGQLESGGWSNSIDFDPNGKVGRYRNGRGHPSAKNNSSLDDGQTQSALQLLILVDEAHHLRHAVIHEAVQFGLDALLAAQYPNGAFPQVWKGPVTQHPTLPASYPSYDWRTEGRVKNYWDLYTLNDNVPGYVVTTLLEAIRVYGEERYRRALRKLGDFLLLAQMPEPQPGWAQQYSFDMHPAWARKFEPPAISGDESQETLKNLLAIYRATGDEKYLDAFPSALAYLRRSKLPDGRLARFYELESNKPLYMKRHQGNYFLTYKDDRLPDHYAWKIQSRLESITREYDNSRHDSQLSAEPVSSSRRAISIQAVRDVLHHLDEEGRWISRYQGERLVGQPKFAHNEPYLSSEVFCRNLRILCDYLAGMQPRDLDE